MFDNTSLSKLALDICKDLNVPYSFGEGYATLDGVPLYCQDNLFKSQAECDVEPCLTVMLEEKS